MTTTRSKLKHLRSAMSRIEAELLALSSQVEKLPADDVPERTEIVLELDLIGLAVYGVGRLIRRRLRKDKPRKGI
jgi:hypothetical protein